MRLIAKWVSQALLVLAAMLTGEWSLIDMFHLVQADGKFHLMGVTAPKAQIELLIRLIVSLSALMLIAATDVWDIYVPRRELRKFRKEYLDLQAPIWRTQLGVDDIRVSVLYARRRWYWPFWKVFEWSWNDGFTPPQGHRDVNLRLACWQGISGRALQTNSPQSVYFDTILKLSFREKWLLGNTFRLTPRQLDKTDHIKGIISMPLMRRGHGDSPSYKAVGVINLDAFTSVGADRLKNNESTLVNYFSDTGNLLASLNVS